MSGTVAELQYVAEPHGLAKSIAQMWHNLDSSRQGWKEEKKELRNYVFATDTTTTSNSDLPWKNSTTLPKLCQIRDNLHSNYLSALFPNDDWLRWEGYTNDDETKEKVEAIQAYTGNKARESKARVVLSDLLYDFIDYGNAFARVKYVHEEKEDEDGQIIPGYIGPRIERISPLDIVFDLRAARFEDTPKVVRSVKTMGEVKKWKEEYPEDHEVYKSIEAAEDVRNKIAAGNREDFEKQLGYQMDGFGSLYDYYTSGFVEMLTLEGDIHDPDTGEFMRDMEIVVIDRTRVISNRKIPSWFGKGTIRHVGWRSRPDNLWSMGPLDNLVGMQYRIDHLENLKADVFDLIAHPPIKIIGQVDEFTWAPNAEIHIEDPSGDVQMVAPDTNALQADFQIQQLETKMEEYAGAPREAMGIRTPGEKTAFEVQALQNAAGRIFQEKITSFEINLLEPLVNDMLESARRNMDGVDYVRVMDDDLGVANLVAVTRADITAKGKIRPIGARHFAAQAQLIQNLSGLMNTGIGQMVTQHIDSMELARLVEDQLNLKRFDLFKKNQQLFEQAEMQRTQQSLAEDLAAEQGVTNTGEFVDEA